MLIKEMILQESVKHDCSHLHLLILFPRCTKTHEIEGFGFIAKLGDGSKDLLFSPLFGEMIQFD